MPRESLKPLAELKRFRIEAREFIERRQQRRRKKPEAARQPSPAEKLMRARSQL